MEENTYSSLGGSTEGALCRRCVVEVKHDHLLKSIAREQLLSLQGEETLEPLDSRRSSEEVAEQSSLDFRIRARGSRRRGRDGTARSCNGCQGRCSLRQGLDGGDSDSCNESLGNGDHFDYAD